MAYDKIVDSAALDGIFTGIADAIREGSGETAQYSPGDMADAIRALAGGGADALTIRTGTIAFPTKKIDTGLSAYRFLAIQAPSFSQAYLYNALFYSDDGLTIQNAYASVSSSNTYATTHKTWNDGGNFRHDCKLMTFSQGVFDFSGLKYDSLSLKSGLTYTWVAVGVA